MRLTPQGVLFAVLFAIAAAIGCIYLSPTHLLKPIRVLTSSATTEAILDDAYQEHVSRRAGITMTAYNVNYTFTVDGKTFRGSSAIDSTPTKTMTVMYLPGDPDVNGLDLKSHAWIDLVIFFVGVGVFLLAVLALFLHFRSPAVVVDEAPSPQRRGRRRLE